MVRREVRKMVEEGMTLTEEIVEMREYVEKTGEGREILRQLIEEKKAIKRLARKRKRCPICGSIEPAHLVGRTGCPSCYSE